MNSVEVSEITKVFESRFSKQKVTALKDFSVDVPEGSIFGLLGPNGAGKTTLVKVLLGITFPTLGSAKILGEDFTNYKLRERIGFLPENHKFPPYLTGYEVLKYFSKLSNYHVENIDNRIDDLLAIVKMTKWKKTKIKKYSKGMMQRLGLAQAMINDPEVIFLDEPTDGVDPIGRKEIRDILSNLKDEGKTIFLNSHLLSEVELTADRVAILNNGELIQEGSVEELTTTREKYKIITEKDLTDSFIKEHLGEFEISFSAKNTINVNVSGTNNLNELIDIIRQNNLNILSIDQQKNTLEDMFISLINETEAKITK